MDKLRLLQKFPIRFITFQRHIGKRDWREQNGLPRFLNTRGVFTDGPDFSYNDNKPTPYTTGQRLRLLIQKDFTEKIVQYLDLIKKVKQRHQRKINAVQMENDKIIASKLKWKGNKPKNLETRTSDVKWTTTRRIIRRQQPRPIYTDNKL